MGPEICMCGKAAWSMMQCEHAVTGWGQTLCCAWSVEVEAQAEAEVATVDAKLLGRPTLHGMWCGVPGNCRKSWRHG